MRLTQFSEEFLEQKNEDCSKDLPVTENKTHYNKILIKF